MESSLLSGVARIGGGLVLALACFSVAADNNTARHRHGDAYPKGMEGRGIHGHALFQERCARCHADSGDGTGPDARDLELKPPSFLTERFRTDFGRREIFTSVALGKLGTHMPTWLRAFDDQDVADVSEYVYRHFVMQEDVISK